MELSAGSSSRCNFSFEIVRRYHSGQLLSKLPIPMKLTFSHSLPLLISRHLQNKRYLYLCQRNPDLPRCEAGYLMGTDKMKYLGMCHWPLRICVPMNSEVRSHLSPLIPVQLQPNTVVRRWCCSQCFLSGIYPCPGALEQSSGGPCRTRWFHDWRIRSSRAFSIAGAWGQRFHVRESYNFHVRRPLLYSI